MSATVPPWPERLGAALRELRRGAGLSQRELARRAGWDVRTVRRAERGESIPSAALVDAWEVVCGRRVAVKVDRRGPPGP